MNRRRLGILRGFDSRRYVTGAHRGAHRPLRACSACQSAFPLRRLAVGRVDPNDPQFQEAAREYALEHTQDIGATVEILRGFNSRRLHERPEASGLPAYRKAARLWC